MTFLENPAVWPRDLSGKRIFLVKAVEEVARELRRKEVRLPPCVYRYDFDLPAFVDASENDKMIVASIINQNTTGDQVRISEEVYYSETFESQVRIENAHVDQKQWSMAASIIQISKKVCAENVTNAIAITAAIFAGVAHGKINALHRGIGRPKFQALHADMLNIGNDEIITARLALGQIDPKEPFGFDPQGSSHIFLDFDSLNRWKTSGGRRSAALEIAERKLIRLAASHPNGLPSHLVKETLMDKEHTGFIFDEKERKLLWDRLPDRPFKLPGVRQDALIKRSA